MASKWKDWTRRGLTDEAKKMSGSGFEQKKPVETKKDGFGVERNKPLNTERTFGFGIETTKKYEEAGIQERQKTSGFGVEVPKKPGSRPGRLVNETTPIAHRYSKPFFRRYTDISGLDEKTRGELDRIGRIIAQKCFQTMRNGGLRQYHMKKWIGPLMTWMSVDVYDNGLGAPLVTVEVRSRRVEEEEEYFWDLFFLKDLDSDVPFIVNRHSSWIAKSPPSTFGIVADPPKASGRWTINNWQGQSRILMWSWSGSGRYSGGYGSDTLYTNNGETLIDDSRPKYIFGACYHNEELIVAAYESDIAGSYGESGLFRVTGSTWSKLLGSDGILNDTRYGSGSCLYFNRSGTKGVMLAGESYVDGKSEKGIIIRVSLSGNLCSITREPYGTNVLYTQSWIGVQSVDVTASRNYTGERILSAIDFDDDDEVRLYALTEGALNHRFIGNDTNENSERTDILTTKLIIESDGDNVDSFEHILYSRENSWRYTLTRVEGFPGQIISCSGSLSIQQAVNNGRLIYCDLRFGVFVLFSWLSTTDVVKNGNDDPIILNTIESGSCSGDDSMLDETLSWPSNVQPDDVVRINKNGSLAYSRETIFYPFEFTTSLDWLAWNVWKRQYIEGDPSYLGEVDEGGYTGSVSDSVQNQMIRSSYGQGAIVRTGEMICASSLVIPVGDTQVDCVAFACTFEKSDVRDLYPILDPVEKVAHCEAATALIQLTPLQPINAPAVLGIKQ